MLVALAVLMEALTHQALLLALLLTLLLTPLLLLLASQGAAGQAMVTEMAAVAVVTEMVAVAALKKAAL
jgi:hypothetical protein